MFEDNQRIFEQTGSMWPTFHRQQTPNVSHLGEDATPQRYLPVLTLGQSLERLGKCLVECVCSGQRNSKSFCHACWVEELAVGDLKAGIW